MSYAGQRLVHSSTLLQMFRDIGYEDLILSGKAVPGEPYSSRPAPSHQPPGAKSESVPYFLDGAKIAVCHQYTLSDGGFGASGKPDPKAISYEGVHLYCHSYVNSKPCPCKTCQADPENWRMVFASLLH